MTEAQYAVVSELLLGWFPHLEVPTPTRAVTFHHGDCVGADEQAHVIARICGFFIVIHPPTDPRKRAWCTGDFVMTPAPYLDRNAAIVRSTVVLVAAPGEVGDRAVDEAVGAAPVVVLGQPVDDELGCGRARQRGAQERLLGVRVVRVALDVHATPVARRGRKSAMGAGSPTRTAALVE
jgi:hypothetical protein